MEILLARIFIESFVDEQKHSLNGEVFKVWIELLQLLGVNYLNGHEYDGGPNNGNSN
jgi:hypothetical protein